MNSPHEAILDQLRQRMVNSQLRARGIKDERVLEAMSRVPRHIFVGDRYRNQAYEDHPLPIGEDQTISQPYIVAVMLEMLALKASDRVLEIGTGSGYATALLSELAESVVSIERHFALANQACDIIQELGYHNVQILLGDGSLGYPQGAPYDAILVSAAAPGAPPALLVQLADSGRMVIPVGSSDSQQLELIRKENGQLRSVLSDPCRFVPLISE
jgi:protein-L-isoaspartate(D-aspartate) O-methyltransferase